MGRKKILITGITGGFGKLLHARLKDEFDVFGTTTQVSMVTPRIFYLDYCNENAYSESPIYELEWDVIILNAAIGIIGNPLEFTFEEMERLFMVNTFGPWKMLKKMRHNKKKIVLVSSSCVREKKVGLRVYGSTKYVLGEILSEMIKDPVLIIYPDAMKTNMKIQFCKHHSTPSWRPREDDWEDPEGYVQKIYKFLL